MRKYLTDANSAHGYVSLQKENLIGIENIYFFKNSHENLTNFMLCNLLKELKKQRFCIEEVYSTFSPTLLSGIVVREKSIAFVSGKEPLEKSTIIDFKEAYDSINEEQVFNLSEKMNNCYEEMHKHFNKALKIHDEWEAIYIDNTDFEKADLFKKTIISQVFDLPKKENIGLVVRRFFGTPCDEKYLDFIPDITSGLKRYFIKGRPGTGKSTLMKNIVSHTKNLGYYTEVYHCSLDPNSVDMVIVPEIDVCIFDSTSPHEYFPTEPTDEIIDTYVEFVKVGLDEMFAQELNEINYRYKKEIKLGTKALKDANKLKEQLNKIYDDKLNIDKAMKIFFRKR